MAKGNPLQEQLLKAGLVKKSKLAEVAREQHKARHGKGAPAPSEIQRDAELARAEKDERDRASGNAGQKLGHADQGPAKGVGQHPDGCGALARRGRNRHQEDDIGRRLKESCMRPTAT